MISLQGDYPHEASVMVEMGRMLTDQAIGQMLTGIAGIA